MARDFKRADRVADVIQHAVAAIIPRELPTTTCGLVTVSAVRMSPDLAWADIYYTVIGSDEQRTAAAQAFARKAGELRHQLAGEVTLRKMPRLKFIFDESVERGANLSALIDSAVAEDRRKSGEKKD